jgi:hypothetical protein
MGPEMMQRRTVPRYEAAISTSPRLQLLHDDLAITLNVGTLSIGRGDACDVLVHDALTSRFHAQITTDVMGSTLEDLGSANGTSVNGTRIVSTHRLSPGDRISVGRVEMRVVDVRTSRTHELRTSTPEPGSVGGAVPRRPRVVTSDVEVTGRLDSFQLFSKLAARGLSEGMNERIEQMLSDHLRDVVESTRQRNALAPDAAEFMGRYAVKLACATRKPRWLDGLVAVFTVARRPFPAATIDELEAYARRLPPVDRAPLRLYVDLLRTSADRLAPGDRMLVQRISRFEQTVATGRGTMPGLG